MNQLIKAFKSIVVIGLILPSLSCASDADFAKEADKLCALYNPNNWGALQGSGDLQQVYGVISARQESELANAAIKRVLAAADASNFSNYYYSVRAGIEAELGEVWECDYFDQFFMPEQTVVVVQLVDVVKKRIDPQADNTIVIMVAHTGEVLINNAPIVSNDDSVLEQAIESTTRGKPITHFSFVLYMDDGANGNLVSRIFRVLKKLGVERVEVIDYW